MGQSTTLFFVAFATLFALALTAPPSYPDCGDSDIVYLADLNPTPEPFPHFWEECVGSGHALLGLRSDWQAQLSRARNELGFNQVRFHGIFDDDMSTLLALAPNGSATYSFFNIDSVYDFLVSIGVKPYVELSFMPELLASGNTTVFHYKGNTTPPKNYTQWADLISTFMSHLIDRYGINEVLDWNFEVWNEPNCGFWTGDQQDYFQLLQVTFDAIKSVDSRLRVGGPATCQSQWLNDTIAFTQSAGFTLDFISTHQYPTDPLPAFNNTDRDFMKKVLEFSRSQVGPDYDLYYSEYNDGLYFPGFHDDPFAAAFVVKNIKDVRNLVQVFSFWTFSDIFEEQGFISTPFHQEFGMMNIYGTPKPSWRAFQLLHAAGDLLVNDTLLTQLPDGAYTSIDIMATINSTSPSSLQILLSNYDTPANAISSHQVCVIVNLPSNITSVPTSLSSTLQHIDANNSNPIACWQNMGMPTYLNSTQVADLNECADISILEATFQPSKYSPTAFSTIVQVPVYGVAGLTLDLSSVFTQMMTTL